MSGPAAEKEESPPSQSAARETATTLGAFLRARRAELDPTAFGIPLSRRRTPGLRREEVAQRANVSATWYTWLEQGRGGAPSSDVLDRISRALMLTDVEREHLFLLGLGRLPEVRYAPGDGISPRLQLVLDNIPLAPAILRTVTWDVVAWNRAATAVLTDYEKIAPGERNVLRQMFLDPATRAAQPHWEDVARWAVGAFRADVARAGAANEVQALVEDLSAQSPEFAKLWATNEVTAFHGGTKTMTNAAAGNLQFEYSAFAVDGRSDLSMVIFSPATADDAERIRKLIPAPAA